MGKQRSKPLLIIVVVLLVGLGFVLFAKQNSVVAPEKTSLKQTVTATLVPTQTVSTIRYTGEEGKDALALLQKEHKITQDSTGMITGIDGKTANAARHEYWAFYINGKMAEVGAADYKSKKGDKFEWKIEKY